MLKPHQIIKDPRFHGLPPIEKLKVLYTVDERYRKLHPRERWKVVNMIPTPPPQKEGLNESQD
jgi:hypothetical protein